MTPNEFRSLALALPAAVEGSHMGHADFRVGAGTNKPAGKIFATLRRLDPGEGDDDTGMVKLTPDQQTAFVRSHPSAFTQVGGGWGLKGATNVHLSAVRGAVDGSAVRRALETAWRNAAPNRLADELGAGP